MKNPLKAVGGFFKKIPATVKSVADEGYERAEAAALDVVAGVVERFDGDALSAALKMEVIKAVENMDFESIAKKLQSEMVEALNERAAELRK